MASAACQPWTRVLLQDSGSPQLQGLEEGERGGWAPGRIRPSGLAQDSLPVPGLLKGQVPSGEGCLVPSPSTAATQREGEAARERPPAKLCWCLRLSSVSSGPSGWGLRADVSLISPLTPIYGRRARQVPGTSSGSPAASLGGRVRRANKRGSRQPRRQAIRRAGGIEEDQMVRERPSHQVRSWRQRQSHLGGRRQRT